MTVTVLSAAKRIASQSGWTLSNLKLQKILYLAHMFYLGKTGGVPLVPGNFEAWDYGPVHPELYQKAKVFGSDPVENIFHGVSDVAPGAEQTMLDEAYKGLGHLGPGKLVNATHRSTGAWAAHYVPGVRHRIIPNSDILKEYRELNNVPA